MDNKNNIRLTTSNLELMKEQLKKNVISPLIEKGFSGKWPHYRRIHTEYIELLTFQIDNQAGSFTVEISAVFSNAVDKNYNGNNIIEPQKVNVWNTNNRYRLKGMYDGWFHYRDLYKKHIPFVGSIYLDVDEKDSSSFVTPKRYRLLQKFNIQTAESICLCVNKQLSKGFKWLNRFVKKHKCH